MKMRGQKSKLKRRTNRFCPVTNTFVTSIILTACPFSCTFLIADKS